MKKLFTLTLCLLCLTAQAATTTISSLPQITAPSTNTYFEVADMSATPKSRKLAILSLKGSIVTNLTDAQIATNAAIARTKIAAGTASHILINGVDGIMNSEATLGAARFPALTGDVTTPGGSLATTIGAGTVTESKLSLSDVTTLNASTNKHGFAPKLPNDATKFYDGTGNFTTPGSSSTPITNFVSITNSFTVAKGGHMTISNNITILTNGTFTLQNLPLPSVLIVGTNGNVTNATLSGLTLGNDNTLTASGGGGASTWVPVTTLAFSTTNVTIPLNGGTNFVVTLTNSSTGYFTSSAAPSSASTNTTFTVTAIQDGTGTRAMNWDTNVFHFMGGVVPVCTTNANAEDVFTISTSAKTAGKMNVVWNPDFR